MFPHIIWWEVRGEGEESHRDQRKLGGNKWGVWSTVVTVASSITVLIRLVKSLICNLGGLEVTRNCVKNVNIRRLSRACSVCECVREREGGGSSNSRSNSVKG